MSSNNPFSQFLAGGGGWLTTKKKGRDDDRIQRDREKAMQARKDARRKKSLSSNGKKPSFATLKKPQKKKRKSSIYDSEEEDLAGFIVDDDDEIEEEFSADSDSEEEKVVPLTRRQSRAKMPVTMDLSSDDDVDAVFQKSTFPTRTRRGPPSASSKHAKKRFALSDASNRRYSEEKKEDELPSSSDDSELEIVNSSRSPYLEQAKETGAAARPAVKDMLDSDDSSQWEAKDSKKNTTKPSAKHALDDSSDDDIPMSFRQRAPDHDDVAEDDDEAAALAWAISESQESYMKEGRKRLKSGLKKKKTKAKCQVVVDIPSPDGEQEEEQLLEEESSGGEEEQDAYVDRDAKEAVSVLQATNELSAKIIRGMAGWSQEKDGQTVPAGIIVDGALSMFQCAQSHESNHSWISQDVMKTICPQVKLADYQLIGVNWLALLHGLTCDVDGKKGGMNVNGILADEMGKWAFVLVCRTVIKPDLTLCLHRNFVLLGLGKTGTRYCCVNYSYGLCKLCCSLKFFYLYSPNDCVPSLASESQPREEWFWRA